MQDQDVQPSGLTRRRVLGGMGGSPSPGADVIRQHWRNRTGRSTCAGLVRVSGSSPHPYPQKGRMILQRSRPAVA